MSAFMGTNTVQGSVLTVASYWGSRNSSLRMTGDYCGKAGPKGKEGQRKGRTRGGRQGGEWGRDRNR